MKKALGTDDACDGDGKNKDNIQMGEGTPQQNLTHSSPVRPSASKLKAAAPAEAAAVGGGASAASAPSTPPSASASASSSSASQSVTTASSSIRPQTIHTMNTEEFDDEGNVTKVEDLIFIDGILGQGEGGGTVRLARRRIPNASKKFHQYHHHHSGTSSVASSSSFKKDDKCDDNTSRNSKEFEIPLKSGPVSASATSPQVCFQDQQHQTGRSHNRNRRRLRKLKKSASAPNDSSFFNKSSSHSMATNSHGNNTPDDYDDNTERTERVSHHLAAAAAASPQSYRHRRHSHAHQEERKMRRKKSRKERSVVGKLGLFTPSSRASGVSFSFDTDDDSEDDDDDDEQLVAVKIFSKSILKRRRTMERDRATRRVKVKTALEQVEREIALMKKLSHPNLLQLYEVIDSEESDMLYMVLEYMPLGEILSYKDGTGTFRRKTRPGAAIDKKYEVDGIVDGHFDEEHAALYFVDILHGLAYLHSHHICHRDLKV